MLQTVHLPIYPSYFLQNFIIVPLPHVRHGPIDSSGISIKPFSNGNLLTICFTIPMIMIFTFKIYYIVNMMRLTKLTVFLVLKHHLFIISNTLCFIKTTFKEYVVFSALFTIMVYCDMVLFPNFIQFSAFTSNLIKKLEYY